MSFRRLGRLSGLTVTSMVITGVLLFAAASLIRSVTSPHEPSRIPPHDVELPALSLLAPETASDLEVLESRPLFHATRRFYLEPVETMAATRSDPPDYELAGAMMLPDGPAIAVLRHRQTSQRIKIRVGDVLDGWTVDEVNVQQVFVSLGDDRVAIGKPPGGPNHGLQRVPLEHRSTTQGEIPGIKVVSGATTASGMPQRDDAQSRVSDGARLYQP